MDSQTPPNPPPGASAVHVSGGIFQEIDFARIVDRLRAFVTDVPQTWEVVKAEAIDIRQIYKVYLIGMLGVAELCGFVGGSILGSSPFVGGLLFSILSFALKLAGVYLFSFISEKMTPYFGGSATLEESFKLTAFSALPAFATGVIDIIPSAFIRFSGKLLGLYGLYLLWLGIPILLNIPAERRSQFFISYVAVVLVLGVVLSSIIGTIITF